MFTKGCGVTLTERVTMPRTEYLREPTETAEVTFICSGHFMDQHYDQRNGKRWPIVRSETALAAPMRQEVVGWLDDDGALHPDENGLPYYREFGPWLSADKGRERTET